MCKSKKSRDTVLDVEARICLSGGVLIDYAATIREAINTTWPGSHACLVRGHIFGLR